MNFSKFSVGFLQNFDFLYLQMDLYYSKNILEMPFFIKFLESIPDVTFDGFQNPTIGCVSHSALINAA